MKLSRSATLIALLIVLTGAAFSTAVATEEIAPDVVALLGQDLAADETNLTDLTVHLDDASVGATAQYEISFSITESTYEFLKNGGLKFAYPDGFDLTGIAAVELTDNSQTFDYIVGGFEAAGQVLTVYLVKDHDDETVGSDYVQVDVSVTVSAIVNPATAAAYQIAAAAFKQNGQIIAGPVLSGFFDITAGTLTRIEVVPDTDIELGAGEYFVFEAAGYDEFGNEIRGLLFTWSLDCGNCLGYFASNVFHATTLGTGHAVARSGNVSGTSGLITVVPGALSRLDLNISDTQFVGYPLRGFADLMFYDAFDNLVSEYSLNQHPLGLSVDVGELVPDWLDDNSLFNNGVVDLLEASVVYDGPSTTTEFTVGAIGSISDAATVSFNGYDVVDVIDHEGETVKVVYADDSHVGTVVWAVIQRGGNLTPVDYVEVLASFKSSSIGIGTFVDPGDLNLIDTLRFDLSLSAPPTDEDTLLVTVVAKYEIDGVTFTTHDTSLYPVAVIPVESFTVVEGTFLPDEITEEVPFEISFDVFSEGFTQSIDSTRVRVGIEYSDEAAYRIVYSGSPLPEVLGDGTLRFEGLPAVLEDSVVTAEGWRRVNLLLLIYSGSLVAMPGDRYPDSIYVRQRPELSTDPSSVMPTSVAAGAVSSFAFDVINDSDVDLIPLLGNSSLRVFNDQFSTTVSLRYEQDAIYPGVNRFYSEGVFIPENQVGRECQLEASVGYQIPNSQSDLLFQTDFDGLLIPVTELPTTQIIDLEVVSPNAPKVNTGQAFQMACTIANKSSEPVSGLVLRLSSDGVSSFEPELPEISIDPLDTVQVFWDVTAAAEPNPAEIFIVDVASSSVPSVLPVDNVTLITIETPADLELTFSVFGSENGLIDYGADLGLTVELINNGMAAVSEGDFLLVAEGLDFDGPDTLTGQIGADRHIDFSFIVPQRDTTVSVSFALLTVPNDLNVARRATIGDTSFAFEVSVISAQATLEVAVTQLGTGLVLPGREKELFQLDLTNTGISSATQIQLDRIRIVAENRDGGSIDVDDVLNIANTGFYENGSMVAGASAGDSLLVFDFDQFLLDPATSRSLVLKTEFLSSNVTGIVLDMPRDGLEARFTSGPNAGMAPAIVSDSEGPSLITQPLQVTSTSLEGSFIAETNPYDPEDPGAGPLRFSYELVEPTSVEFRIFSVIGEEVYARDYVAGGEGGETGENIIEWDGRNSKGHVVVNGVYIALMRNSQTGETATIKIAIVK